MVALRAVLTSIMPVYVVGAHMPGVSEHAQKAQAHSQIDQQREDKRF